VAESIERKLATIMAADAAGYSRAMAADEVGALRALKEARAVFARLIERHRGRIANTAGDGLIAEFPSVVEAVQCAVEVQRELAARDQLSGDPMAFRIGLHLGDVMLDHGDLFGEGVNLAARLQAMAQPGGILISQAVYDQVRTKLAIGYELLGERQPRNLVDKVTIYRVVLDGPPALATGSSGASEPDKMPRPEVRAPHRGSGLRARVLGHTRQLAILWAGLAAINLATGSRFWAVWPGIAFATLLALEAAPLAARGWIDVQLIRAAAIVLGLALVNLATWSGEPWFLWPAGVLVVLFLVHRAGRGPA